MIQACRAAGAVCGSEPRDVVRVFRENCARNAFADCAFIRDDPSLKAPLPAESGAKR